MKVFLGSQDYGAIYQNWLFFTYIESLDHGAEFFKDFFGRVVGSDVSLFVAVQIHSVEW